MIMAQLSDIHFGEADDALARLDRVLDWLKDLRPDRLIVSGDLAEVSHATGYAAIKTRLDRFGSPYSIVPGNVDDHAALRDAFGGDQGWTTERPLNCIAEAAGEARVIGLDVTVAGEHFGDAAPVLPWLAEQLEQGAPALIFMHQHPFFCGIDRKDLNKCRGSEGLAELIESKRERVLGVTCGHVHRAMFTRFAGLPATMAPSVGRANKLRLDGKESWASDPPGLLLHHFKEGRLVSHVVMVGS